MATTTNMQDSLHFDTIVIGAGMSGLACAARLFQHRARGSLVVLEARDRVGGRIGSVYVNGNRLDTGANWIHGIGTEEKPNPLMQVLPHKRYKQLSGMVAFRPSDGSNSVKAVVEESSSTENGWQEIKIRSKSSAKPTGDLVIPSEHVATLMGTVWGTIGEIHEVAHDTPASEAKRTTMLSSISNSKTFREAFKELPPDYHEALGGLPQFLETMEAAPLAAQSSEHPQDAPAMSLLEFAIDDFDGDQVFLQDGYTALIDEIAKDLIKANAIKTGVEVDQINWYTNPISIRTTAGTYTAGTVVCTIPLGVMKRRMHPHISNGSQSMALFKPELPMKKNEAISNVGFGTLDKIFLVYTSPWWNEEPYLSILKKGISRRPYAEATRPPVGDPPTEADSFLGFTHELPGIVIEKNGNVRSGVRMISIMNLHSLCGFPVLSCFVSCANAIHIESLSNEEAGALIHRSLTEWLGREPPSPAAVHVTRWASDPYAYGSYSHMITGLTDTKHREEFQAPIRNQHGNWLRFAGEHTSRNHFATVHGALLSGWREADEILKG